MTIVLQAQNFTINAVGGILDSRAPAGVQVNRPPVVSTVPDLSLFQGSTSSVSSYASDPDGDALTFRRLSGTAPTGVTISNNGVLAIQSDVPPGTYTLQFEADDGKGSIEQDWQYRAGGAGVVWAHDFRNAAEFTQFLSDSPSAYHVGDPIRLVQDGPYWCIDYHLLGAIASTISHLDTTVTVNDASSWPLTDFWVQCGVAGRLKEWWHVLSRAGNVLTLEAKSYGTYTSRYTLPGGSEWFTEPQDWTAGAHVGQHVMQRWNRPFSAFSAPSNGKPIGQDDKPPATRPLRTWTPLVSGGDALYSAGYYGHANYRAAFSGSWKPQDGYTTYSNVWDGNDFYIQFRVKVDQAFWDEPEHQSGGYGFKLEFCQSLISTYQQVIINIMQPYYDGVNKQPKFMMSTRQASDPYPSTDAWRWVGDEWITVMFHVVPGTHLNLDTMWEAWVCRQDVTPGVWVKVIDRSDVKITYSDGETGAGNSLPGWCAFGPCGYFNMELGNKPPARSWHQKFTQCIFSTAPIPAPLA